MYEKSYIWVKVEEEGPPLKAFSTLKLAAASEAKEIFELPKKDFIDVMLDFFSLTSINKALKDETLLNDLKNKFIAKIDEVDLEDWGWYKITLNDLKEV